ncbi:MAG: carboxypeptidase-like regulatory domain-containing protein [Myxococcota bacterium]
MRYFLVLLLALGGCAVSDEASVCDQAAVHVAECYGVEATAPTSCDPGAAAEVLGTECSALDQGKADGWWCIWNPFLPGCGGGDRSTTHDLRGGVDFAWDAFGSQISSISCAEVVLENADGEEVGRASTNVHGSFLFEDLEEGDYVIRVLDREGDTAKRLGGDDAVTAVTLEADLRVDMILGYYADGEEAAFGSGLTSEEAVGRCARVDMKLNLENRCGEAVPAYFEVRRDWVLVLENEDRAYYSTPLCQPADGDHWNWDGCGPEDVVLNTFINVSPGSYTLSAFRADLPDRNNLDLERELRIRSTDPGELSETEVEVEIGTDVSMGVGLVDPRSDC